MRQLTIMGIVAVGLALSGCTPGALEGPSLREVSFGFESVGDPELDWAAQAELVDEVGANGVSISVGRPEWTAFRWDAHPDAASTPARQSDDDLVETAIDAVGGGRSVTLVVDALMPGLLAEEPSLAGTMATGEQSETLPSVAALEGPIGDRIVEYVGAVAERYSPDVVSITEMFFDDATFGEADLESYHDATGEHDWPRDGEGRIVDDDPRIEEWRSQAVTDVVARAAEAAHEHGAELAVDVRIDIDDPAAGRPDSGHDYRALLEVADQLVLWHFPGEDGTGAEAGSALSAGLADAGFDLDRLVVQVGMWGRGGGSIDASELERALRHAATNGVDRVSVAPASMLDADDWQAIASSWG